MIKQESKYKVFCDDCGRPYSLDWWHGLDDLVTRAQEQGWQIDGIFGKARCPHCRQVRRAIHKEIINGLKFWKRWNLNTPKKNL